MLLHYIVIESRQKMKRNKFKYALLLLAAVMVTSCDGLRFGKKYYKVEEGTNFSNRALDDAMDMSALNSLGTQKLLVIPVVFTNTQNVATEENHAMLERVFFGESDDTGWESVASYYKKSSYGRLNLTGEVMPYFQLDYSTIDLANKFVSATQKIGPGNYWDETHHVIEDIYNTYDAELLKEYDTDGDGFVDALWMVYMADINAAGSESSVFWAYKFYWNRLANKNKPTPNTYAWASYRFATEGVGYTHEKPDAHTYIHETGHVLSLPDYYDYDSDHTGMQATNPTGGLDMMAYNVGDHNPYSKYRYNWLEPYVFTGDVDIPLKPFESSGDTILIKNEWNQTAYDEYLLIDYYTPTGLNAKDSEGRGYASQSNPNSGTRNFTKAGVRIWHVDSRLVRHTFNENDELESSKWTNEIYGDEYVYTDVGPSNTASRSRADESVEQPERFKLLHLLDAKGRTSKVGNWLRSGTVSGDDALFVEGQIIEADDWGKYLQTEDKSATFNDGSAIGYSVEIGEMTDNQVIIKIRVAN